MSPRSLPERNNHPMRILVVEDDPLDMEIIKRALRKCTDKPELLYASDGEEALDLLFRKGKHADAPRPDIIISCLQLPRIDGAEVLSAVKREPLLQRMPFIVLTGSRREEDLMTAYTNGASGFMVKPVDEEEFEAVVQAIYSYWHLAMTPLE